jgi:hypothetical protein
MNNAIKQNITKDFIRNICFAFFLNSITFI